MRRNESGNANLTAIVVLVGVVITGVWVWKRLSLDTQEYVIDQAIPMVFAGLVIAAGLWMLVRALNRRRAQRRERAKLLAAFERATVQEKKLEIAFELIDVNGYRAEGLETVTPALRDLFATTLQRALGDKQHRNRGMAASYLGVLNDKTVIPLLLKALEDDHAYVRSCAALGLGRLRASEAKEKLTTVMKEDWDQTVRRGRKRGTGYFVAGLTGPTASRKKMVSGTVFPVSRGWSCCPRNRRRPRSSARTIPADRE